MMVQEVGLHRDVEYGVRIWQEKTKPFCGVAFALRGAGLFGLERDGVRDRTKEAGYAP